MKPDVSIVMSVYNEIDYVEETIKSVLGQSFKNLELIIVLDTLDEGIMNKVFSFSDPRLHIFKNTENIGLTKSLNFAIGKATGTYIARIDADDIAHEERIEKQFQFLNDNEDIGVVGSNARIIDEVGQIIGKLNLKEKNNQITKGLLFKNQIIHPSVMMRKTIFDDFGLYNEKLKRSQDYELWLRLRKKVKFHNLSDYLLFYRKHNQSITQSSNIEQRTTGIEMMYKYLMDHKTSLNFREKATVFFFFLKQFYKIIRSAF